MTRNDINYQVYVAIGICIILFLVCLIYFTKKFIEKSKTIKTLKQTKKWLMDKFNIEKTRDVRMTIEKIKNDINVMRQEITISQEKRKLEKKNQIEKQINTYYEQIVIEKRAREMAKEIVYQWKINRNDNLLHREQVRIMNQNINKFLIVYKEKDKMIEERNRAIEEKNTSIDILQQKITELEGKMKKQTDGKNEKEIPDKEMFNIEENINIEKRKMVTLIILFVLFWLLSIWWVIAIYMYYI